MLHRFSFMQLGVDESQKALPGGSNLWRHKPVAGWVPTGKHQHKKTQGPSPWGGGALFLEVILQKCKFLFPTLGSFVTPHRLRKVSFSPCYPLPEKSQSQHGVSLRLIVLSLFQLPISKLANSMFTSSVPKSVTQNFHVWTQHFKLSILPQM